MTVMTREDVEFRTVDGLTLRGWLYPSGKRGPALVMTQGFNASKEYLLADVAVWFQKRGVTSLLVDIRTTGLSDGEPRNDIDLDKQVEDCHDAVSFLSRHPSVDPEMIVYWGYSLGAVISLCAAALDKRAAAVIATAPNTDFIFDPVKRAATLSLAMRDRVSRLAGNPPLYLKIIGEDGQNPAGWYLGEERRSPEELDALFNSSNIMNQVTIQSYYRLLRWQPFGLMPSVSPTPVMVVTPSDDDLSKPENQRKLFDIFQEPKEFVLAENKGHMNCISGVDGEQFLQKQLEFMKRMLKF
ncbi:Atr5 [Stachybotrys chartarum IBT 40288]|nr:Atr5 [Stachybotrys chartarum IBT 40288]